MLLLMIMGSDEASADDYHDYDSMVNQINIWELESDEIVKVSDLREVYGTPNTYEGRRLWLVTISDEDTLTDGGENESQILFLGGLEGRNWMSVEICMGFLGYLVDNYQDDPRVRSLVDNNEIYVIPMVNPDGSQYSRENDDPGAEGEDGWIKNRNDTHGTNINRNFDHLWNRDLESGINDTSGDPDDFSYAGADIASEYESQALISLIEDRSLTSIVLFDGKGRNVTTIPFAKEEANFAEDASHVQNSEDEAALTRMADYLASLLDYAVNEENPYIISGDFLDWCYDEHRQLSVKIAVGDSYIPPQDTIAGITANYSEMCLNAVELSYYFRNLSYVNSMESESGWNVFSSQTVWSLLDDRDESYDGNACWTTEGFDNSATGSLATEKDIDLEGLAYPKLSFFHRYELELNESSSSRNGGSGQTSYAGDGGFVEVKEPGEDYVQVHPTDGYPYRFPNDYEDSGVRSAWAFSGNAREWHQVVFDLREFSEKQIKVRFRFSSNEADSSGGWWIDHLFIYDGEAPAFNMSLDVVNDGADVFPGQVVPFNVSLKNTGERTDTYTLTGTFVKGNETGKLNVSFSSRTIDLVPTQEEQITVYVGLAEGTLESGEINLTVEARSWENDERLNVSLSARFGEVFDLDFQLEKTELLVAVNSSFAIPFWLNSSSNVETTVLLSCSRITEDWLVNYGGDDYEDNEFEDVPVVLLPEERKQGTLTLVAPEFEKAGVRVDLTFTSVIQDQPGSWERSFNGTVAETQGIELIIEESYAVTPGEDNSLQIEVKNTGNVDEHIFLDFVSSFWNISFRSDTDESFVLATRSNPRKVNIKLSPPQDVPFDDTRTMEIRGRIKSDDSFIYATSREMKVQAGVSTGVRIERVSSEAEVLPGEKADFRFRLHNTGNVEEAFYLRYDVPSEWEVTFPGGGGPFSVDPFSSTLVSVEVTAGEGSYQDILTLSFWGESEDGKIEDDDPLDLSVRIGPEVNFILDIETELEGNEVEEEAEFIFRFTVENKGNGRMTFYVNATSLPGGWDYTVSKNGFALNRNDKRSIYITLIHDTDTISIPSTESFSFSVETLGEKQETDFELSVARKPNDSSEGSQANIGLIILPVVLIGAVVLFLLKDTLLPYLGIPGPSSPDQSESAAVSESTEEEAQDEGDQKHIEDFEKKEEEDRRSPKDSEEEEDSGEEEPVLPPLETTSEEEEEEPVLPPLETTSEEEEEEPVLPPVETTSEEEEEEPVLPPVETTSEEEEEDEDPFAPPLEEPGEGDDESIPPSMEGTERDDDSESGVPQEERTPEDDDEFILPPIKETVEEDDEPILPPLDDTAGEDEDDDLILPPIQEEPPSSRDETGDEEIIPPAREKDTAGPKAPPTPEPEKPRVRDELVKKTEAVSGAPEKRNCPSCGRIMYIKDFSQETKCLWCGTYVKFKRKSRGK